MLRPSGLWSRAFRVPAEPFEVTTADGVGLRGHRLGEGEAEAALVFCHGFLGWHQKGRLVLFQEQLARRYPVYGFDFRGHGRSEGQCAFGVREHRDVEAVVLRARADGFDRVVTLGGSMGGVAVIRHAGLLGGVDAVVTVSTPASWEGHRSAAVRRMEWLTTTENGRWMARVWGTRVGREWEWAEAPAEVIGRISPTPVVIVHGRDDHFFDEGQAWLLYRMAREPKRLLLASRFGHAEDGYTPAFAGFLTNVVAEVLGVPSTATRHTKELSEPAFTDVGSPP